MSPTDPKILSQIQALIARASHNTTPEEEARTCAVEAVRRMVRHSVTPNELMACLAESAREHMRALGRRGGEARARNLSAAELSAIGRKGGRPRGR